LLSLTRKAPCLAKGLVVGASFMRVSTVKDDDDEPVPVDGEEWFDA
jgi:hypothetical protein